MPFSIVSYEFSKPVRKASEPYDLLSSHPQGTNWPVVYIIHGSNELYIGETNNANERMNQHLDQSKTDLWEKRKRLNRVEIVFDSWFNKSAILDIENALIGLFRYEIQQVKDKTKKSKYFTVLQNGNSGQSKLHNYYNRAHYQDEVELIWEELRKRSIATNRYHDIVNDVLFKYSPYTALNEEQQSVTLDILNGIMDSLEAIRRGELTDYTAVVNGVAGTGKTVVLINMLVRIVEAIYSNQTNIDSDNDDVYETNLALGELSPEAKLVNRIKEYVRKYGKLKIAYVAQMTSLRKTMGAIFKEVPHLYENTAKGPNQIVNTSFDTTGTFKPYDILFVDEAHRLWQYRNIQNRGSYKQACEKLYGKGVKPEDYTTMDWICKCSRTRVFIYDPFQTVKDSDITPKQFEDAVLNRPAMPLFFELKQQMRCRAGSDYIGFVDSLFNGDYASASELRPTKDYDFRFFEDPNDLIEEIVKRHTETGLSKCATGYGWQWERKRYDECNKKYHKWLKKTGEADTRKKQLAFYLDNLNIEDGLIDFSGKRYVRNLDFDWILKGEPQEIGCIHTSQGYDLNYVGVLFGPEINYDPEKGIIVYPELIKDKGVNRTLTGLSATERSAKYDAIKNYVINAYKVMMERGIKCCYIYAYNEGLRDYLKSMVH